jgi:hypothetical protein
MLLRAMVVQRKTETPRAWRNEEMKRYKSFLKQCCRESKREETSGIEVPEKTVKKTVRPAVVDLEAMADLEEEAAIAKQSAAIAADVTTVRDSRTMLRMIFGQLEKIDEHLAGGSEEVAGVKGGGEGGRRGVYSAGRVPGVRVHPAAAAPSSVPAASNTATAVAPAVVAEIKPMLQQVCSHLDRLESKLIDTTASQNSRLQDIKLSGLHAAEAHAAGARAMEERLARMEKVLLRMCDDAQSQVPPPGVRDPPTFSETSDLFSSAAADIEEGNFGAAKAAVSAEALTGSGLHERLQQAPPVSSIELDSRIDDLRF